MLALCPVVFFWLVMAVAGEPDQLTALDISLSIKRLNGEDAKIPVTRTFPVDSLSPVADFECKAHGWPYRAMDQVYVYAKDVDLANKPGSLDALEFQEPAFGRFSVLRGRGTVFVGSFNSSADIISREADPFWLSTKAWTVSGDWTYIYWPALLANLGWAIGSILVVCLLCEFRFRCFGAKIRLWEFLLCVMIAGVVGALIGSRINTNLRIQKLAESDTRYVFDYKYDPKYAWAGRLFGSKIKDSFYKFENCEIYWDPSLKADFWKPLVDANGLESARITNFRYDDIGIPLPKQFFKAIGKMNSLNTLRLEYCKIETKDLEHLKSLSNLNELALKQTPVQDEAIEILADVKSLVTVSLTGTGISAEAIKRLRKLRPQLQITN